MHWNVPPDVLPGSAMFVRVLDRWLNDCLKILGHIELCYYIINTTSTINICATDARNIRSV